MELIDKQKLLEVLDEEIYVYSPEDGIRPEFDKGVLYLANKLKAVVNLHTLDDHSAQEEIERQHRLLDNEVEIKERLREEIAKLKEALETVVGAHSITMQRAIQAEQERNALLEGLKHISTITERQWCMDDPIEIARSTIAKIEGK